MSERQASTFRKGTFTGDAVRVAAALNKAKIACSLEWIIPRYGEYTDSGQLKIYSLDILVHDPRYATVAIEMEGKGSASKDNVLRDEYLMSHGIEVILHYPNGTPSEEIIAELDGYARESLD